MVSAANDQLFITQFEIEYDIKKFISVNGHSGESIQNYYAKQFAKINLISIAIISPKISEN